MQASQIPAKFPLKWAQNASGSFIRPVPTNSQIGIQNGAASLNDGYPPLTFLSVSAGGAFPFGQDTNGILNQITAWSQWQNAGAAVLYDSSFSTSIGGYPAGAILYAVAGNSWWLNQTDNNTTNPDTGGAGWQKLTYGIVYAGNPNGNVAGVSAVNGFTTASLLWDSAHSILWMCTVTGNAATAVWTQISGNTNTAIFWCGTSSGTANAQVLTTPANQQTFGTGAGLAFIAGATNTGAITIQVGAFGTFNVRKDSLSGPVALTGGEIVSGSIINARFDGTNIQLMNIALGSAASANASSTTGTVAAVTGSGSITVGHLAVFGDVVGTIIDGGAPSAPQGNYINSNATVAPGKYLVDTTAGPITLTLLAAAPTGSAWEFIDCKGTFTPNNLIVNIGSYTFTPPFATATVPGPFKLNTIGEDTYIWFDGTTLRLT